MKRILPIVACTIALAGLTACETQTAKNDAPAAEKAAATAAVPASFDAAVAEAKAAIKKAESVGGEWRDTGKFLKEAEEAAAAGDMDKAMKLVSKAKFQAEMGYDQAMAERNVGNPSYLN